MNTVSVQGRRHVLNFRESENRLKTVGHMMAVCRNIASD